MKNFDEIMFSKDFETFIYSEPDFNVLLDLKNSIQEKLKSFENNDFIPSEINEAEKIALKYGKAAHDKVLALKSNLQVLSERIEYISYLKKEDVETFISTLNEEKLSKISANDFATIADKLDNDTFFSLLERIQMLKVPYVFKKECPEFFDTDLSILSKIRSNKFPVSDEVKEILASGKFDHSENSSNSLEER